MRNLNYLGLSEKVAELGRLERKRSLQDSLGWPDNLEALPQSIPNRDATVKLAFGLTGPLAPLTHRYLTTDGKAKKWCYENQEYTDE